MEQNTCSRFYKILPYKNQFFQSSLLLQKGKKINYNNNYPKRKRDLYQPENMYLLIQDVKSSQNSSYYVVKSKFFNFFKLRNLYVNISVQYVY